jgi:hypothetical protein
MSERVSAEWEIYADCNSTHVSFCSIIKHSVKDNTVKKHKGIPHEFLNPKCVIELAFFVTAAEFYGKIFFSPLCYPAVLQTLEIHLYLQARPRTLSHIKWMIQKIKLLGALVELYCISEYTE